SGNSTLQVAAAGGGVFAGSPLTVVSSTIAGNSTRGEDAEGGGIGAQGSVTLINSTFSGNSTAGDGANGGGVSGQSIFAADSTITGNSVAGTHADGGGLAGSVTLRNSIVAGNQDLQNNSRPDLFAGVFDIQFSLIGNCKGTSLAEANPKSDAKGNKI